MGKPYPGVRFFRYTRLPADMHKLEFMEVDDDDHLDLSGCC